MDITNLLNSLIPPWWSDVAPWALLIAYVAALILFKSVRKVSLFVIGAFLILQALFEMFSIGGRGGGMDDE